MARVFEAAPAAEGCLRGRVQWIVVNNASSPEFAAWLETAAPPFVELLAEPKPGVSVARNTGVRRAEAEVVLFTDADAVPGPGWVRAAVEGLERTGAGALRGFERAARRFLRAAAHPRQLMGRTHPAPRG